MIEQNNILIKKLLDISDIKKIQDKNIKINFIINTLNQAYLTTYKKENIIEKLFNNIKTFFTP